MTDALDPDSHRGLSHEFDKAGERLVEAILRRNTARDATHFLRALARSLDLSHIACQQFHADERRDVVAAGCLATWPEDWQARYRARRYHEVDPVVLVGTHASCPFDWRSFRLLMPEAASFLADAAAHGAGTNGLTVPLQIGPNGFALVSFASHAGREVWDAYRRIHWARLKTLACLVHVLAGVNAAPAPVPVARPRVLSMLQGRFGLVAARARKGGAVGSVGL